MLAGFLCGPGMIRCLLLVWMLKLGQRLNHQTLAGLPLSGSKRSRKFTYNLNEKFDEVHLIFRRTFKKRHGGSGWLAPAPAWACFWAYPSSSTI
jgi:hypothetical protein